MGWCRLAGTRPSTRPRVHGGGSLAGKDSRDASSTTSVASPPGCLGSSEMPPVGFRFVSECDIAFLVCAQVCLWSLPQRAQVDALVLKVLDIHCQPGFDERQDSMEVLAAVERDCGGDSALFDVACQKAT